MSGIPDYGVSANDPTDFDSEYIERMSRKPKDLRQYHNVRLPISEIRDALRVKELEFEPGDERYVRARLEDVGLCPLCDAQNFNRELLRRHIEAHDEVQGFLQGVIEAERQHERLRERREQLTEQIEKAKNELQMVENKIRKIDRSAMARRQAEYQELFGLLYGSAA